MMKEMLKGAMVAAAVGSLLAAGAARAEGAKDKKEKISASEVKCAGINECKGQGGCASANNACAGQNGCEGQGVTATKSEKECNDRGSKVTAQK
jgi:uncharacterized membrane protein